jgi:hypothetical protein
MRRSSSCVCHQHVSNETAEAAACSCLGCVTLTHVHGPHATASRGLAGCLRAHSHLLAVHCANVAAQHPVQQPRYWPCDRVQQHPAGRIRRVRYKVSQGGRCPLVDTGWHARYHSLEELDQGDRQGANSEAMPAAHTLRNDLHRHNNQSYTERPLLSPAD